MDCVLNHTWTYKPEDKCHEVDYSYSLDKSFFCDYAYIRLNSVDQKGHAIYNMSTDIKQSFVIIILVVIPNGEIQTQHCRKEDTIQTCNENNSKLHCFQD